MDLLYPRCHVPILSYPSITSWMGPTWCMTLIRSIVLTWVREGHSAILFIRDGGVVTFDQVLKGLFFCSKGDTGWKKFWRSSFPSFFFLLLYFYALHLLNDKHSFWTTKGGTVSTKSLGIVGKRMVWLWVPWDVKIKRAAREKGVISGVSSHNCNKQKKQVGIEEAEMIKLVVLTARRHHLLSTVDLFLGSCCGWNSKGWFTNSHIFLEL
jgi:hypothetical protein